MSALTGTCTENCSVCVAHDTELSVAQSVVRDVSSRHCEKISHKFARCMQVAGQRLVGFTTTYMTFNCNYWST